jgi:glycine/D-amino acid oxidase-like deaminating enzyme/nitrite reductase/ring-hydroxylating ferredoxin subunit
MHNKETAQLYYEMNENALKTVEKLVTELKLECEFERRNHTCWASEDSNVDLIRKEYSTCKELGIDCQLLEKGELEAELPSSINAKLGVTFKNQVQFNSYKFCTELCKHIDGGGCSIFEESRVTSVSNDQPHQLKLEENNSSITSDMVVLATHLPIMDQSMHFAFLEPSRSHCIAVRVEPHKLHNMFINVDSPLRSLRTSHDDSVVVVSGESFKQGDETDTDRFYSNLINWAQQHLNTTEVLTKWSAMDYFSTDHLPFIGYLHRSTKTIFTATGFSKWGLSNSVAGAQIVADLIDNKANPFHQIVDARRWDLTKQLSGLAQEGWHTTKHLIGDKIKHLLKPSDIKSLKAGEGAVVNVENQKVGAYLDHNGQYHLVKPVCTHMGCDLVFNQGDTAWDCPCHGSRFDVEGKVIHGPACKSLHQIKDLQW